MSEGPEVKIIADKLAAVLVSKKVEDIYGKSIESEIKSDIVGNTISEIETFGKNIVISFSSGIFLRNHMMMWGKWRIYTRATFDQGLAHPPRRSLWQRKGPKNKPSKDLEKQDQIDVRLDRRVRLVILTSSHAVVQFNGPILEFLRKHPSSVSPISLLGPDPLSVRYDKRLILKGLEENGERMISDLLLDQTFVAGIGNKYKSEILFQVGLCPFMKTFGISRLKRIQLVNQIHETLTLGYNNNGKTRMAEISRGEGKNEHNRWTDAHWVFRRAGRPCWKCGNEKIRMDRKRSSRVTYWCPRCQRSLK